MAHPAHSEQLPPSQAAWNDSSNGTAYLDGKARSELAHGKLKRRPASPEVVVSSRPRTPSSNGNASFEQSQSPSKKQRRDHNGLSIDSQLDASSIFTSLRANTPPASMDKIAGSDAVTATSQDAGLALTTETFANLSTLTPGSSRHEAATHSEVAPLPAASKPSSPSSSSRRQSNVVVEIIQSRPGSAAAQRSSPAREEGKTFAMSSRPSSPLSAFDTEENDGSAGIYFLQDASDDIPSYVASPELEEIVLPKSRSRRTSPRPYATSALKELQEELPTSSSYSSSSSAISVDARSKPLPTSSQIRSADSGTSEGPTIHNAASEALPLSAIFENPRDGFFVNPSRQATKQAKRYVEASSDDDQSDELYVAASPATTAGKSKAKPNSRKGKERAVESDSTSPTEDEPPSKAPRSTNGQKLSREAKKTKDQSPPSASRVKGTPAKKRPNSQPTGKARGRRKADMSSGSSDLEDLFAMQSPSPSKKKKTATGKPKSPVKKAAAGKTSNTSLLSVKQITDLSSDDDLPMLPFSSQPTSNSQKGASFDLLEIDDLAMVAVPAMRKHADDQRLSPPSPALCFWWPARIANRNRRNFTVSLVLDEPNREVLKFGEATFVISEQNLDQDHLQKLSSRVNPCPQAKHAYEAILKHPEAEHYALPSDAAYSSALSTALKKERDDLKPLAKTNVKANRKTNPPSPDDSVESITTASDLDLLNEGRLHFGSDTDDESDIEIDTVGLGKTQNSWWPCRVIGIVPRRKANGQPADPKERRRPYRVEFYPKQVMSLSRKDIVTKTDPEFFTVPLGEIQTSDSSPLIPLDKLRDILPEMAETATGKYTADRKRHAYFVDGTPVEKNGLAQMVVFGQYDRKQVDQLSDFLMEWAYNRSKESVTIPPDAPFHSFASDEQKTNYVALVLLPVALELLALKDDTETVERAIQRLEEAGNKHPTDAEIRAEAHNVVAEDLSSSTDWWESILTLRQAQQASTFLHEAMRTELDDDDLAAMGLITRRRKKNVNYKE